MENMEQVNALDACRIEAELELLKDNFEEYEELILACCLLIRKLPTLSNSIKFGNNEPNTSSINIAEVQDVLLTIVNRILDNIKNGI